MRRTDILIAQLAGASGWSGSRKQLAFVIPLVAAALTCTLMAFFMFGLPLADMPGAGWRALAGKWCFSLLLTGGALASLYTLAHPGRRSSKLLLIALIPLGALAAIFLLELTGGSSALGDVAWQRCLLAMGLLSPIGFIAAICALRLLAPVRLRRAGFAAGLFSGGLAASVYAPFCTGQGALFVALFYGGPIALLAAIGWLAGARLLRW